MNFHFKAEKGLDAINIGMKREEVRKKLGDCFQEKPPHKYNEHYSDYFNDNHVKVFYNTSDYSVEFIEIMMFKNEVFLNGKNINNITFKNLVEKIKEIDADIIINENILYSKKYCFAIYVHNLITKNEKIDTFSVYSKKELEDLLNILDL